MRKQRHDSRPRLGDPQAICTLYDLSNSPARGGCRLLKGDGEGLLSAYSVEKLPDGAFSIILGGR